MKKISDLIILSTLSLLFIWLLSAFTKDSPLEYTFCKELGKYIYRPSSIQYQRSEGRGKTVIGKYGINKYNESKISKKIILWGDSYVEARQVDDDKKISQLVNNYLTENSIRNLEMLSIGQSGDSICDAGFDLPNYNKVINNTKINFFLFTNFADSLPNNMNDSTKAIFKSNPLRIDFLPPKPNETFQKIKRIINDYKLYFLWSLYDNFKNKEHSNISKLYDKSETNDEEAWIFLINYLIKQSNGIPFVFVYAPPVPFIYKNDIKFIEEDSHKKQKFISIANSYNIKVIDLTDKFIAHFQSSNEFPCGFQNSKPSLGHFNETGHKLVAEAICDFIKKYGDNYDIY